MPKRISSKNSKDVNELADYLDKLSTEGNGLTAPLPSKEQISVLMSVMGRKGGKIGGKRRLETMTAQERRSIAKKAAQARWQRKEK